MRGEFCAIQFAALVELITGKKTFCFYFVEIFKERIKICGSADKFKKCRATEGYHFCTRHLDQPSL